MALILGIAAAAHFAQIIWRKITSNPTTSLMASRNVKLSTNLIVVIAQGIGYVAELLGGTRTTTPSTSSTTTAVDGSQVNRPVPTNKFATSSVDS